MLRGLLIRLLPLVGCLLACNGAVASDRFELMLAEVTLNGGSPHPSFVLRDADGDYWIEESLADSHRVNGTRPPVVEHRDMRFLPVAGFEGSDWTFHASTVALDITIPPRFMQQQVRTVRQNTPVVPRMDVGAFVDYDFFYENAPEDESELFSALFSPTFFGGPGVVRNALIYRSRSYEHDDSDPDFGRVDDYDAGDGWIRLESTFVRDDPVDLRSLRIGDGLLAPGMLGVASRFGGIQVATNFDTQPSLVTFPLPQLSGEALLNSDVEIFVNGQQTLRDAVAPGPFRFSEIPVSTGGGELQLLTRDLTGREQLITTDFYVSQRVLRQGLSEYSYSVGSLRRDYGVESNDYGNLVLAGFHRYGYSDSVTVEGQGQATNEVQRAGGGLTLTRVRFGVASAGIALSNDDDAGLGYEFMLAHEFRQRSMRLTSSLRYGSEDHRQISYYDNAARPETQVALGGGYSFDRRGTLSATLGRRTYHNSDSTDIVSASYTLNLRRGPSIVAYATRYSGDNTEHTVGLSFVQSLGGRRSASLDVVRRESGTRLMAESQQSLPAGPGLGYRFAGGQDDGEDLWEGGASLHTRTGRYSAAAEHDSDGTNWRASASGSAAWIGGLPFMTREVRDAFSVVKVNGFEGVTVFLENQPMGRTDSTGRIMLPGLRPFEENRVRIEMEDLPLDARIDDLEKIVTPYAGAGALADFPVSEGRDVLLRLLLPDGQPAGQGGYVVAGEQQLRHPVGIDGAVYLRDVEDGDYAVLHFNDQRCGFTVELDGRPGPVPDLGDVHCDGEFRP